MEERSPDRTRLIVAGVLAAALVGAIAAVVLSRGEDGIEVEPAEAECVSAWNADDSIIRLGVHQFNGHGYDRVQVLRLAANGEKPTPPEQGECAVVFAAAGLDPELGAAAQILEGGRWHALSDSPDLEPSRLRDLQSTAVGGANARLEDDGTLTAREP